MDFRDEYLESLLNEGAILSINEAMEDIEVPTWYNRSKILRAQRYFQRNFAAMYYATICGLLPALTVPSILNALIYTSQNITFKMAVSRYLAAMRQTLVWYSEPFEPGSSSWKALEYVRHFHLKIVKRPSIINSGIIISQKDLVITQFAFLGYIILKPDKIGAQTCPQDLEALCHFWRVLGLLLGLEDRFNICTENMDDTVHRIQQVHEHLKWSLVNKDDRFEGAAEPLVSKLWCFNPLLDHGALMFAAGRLAGLPGHGYWYKEIRSGENTQYKQLGWKSRAVLFTILGIHEGLLRFDLIRQVANWILLTSGKIVLACSEVVSRWL